MLIEQIRQDFLQARKDRDTDKLRLLSTLYAEASAIGKNSGNRDSTDEEVQRVIKKFLKAIEENRKLGFTKNIFEQRILESYLPKQMSEDEIRRIVLEMVSIDQTIQIGSVMKNFKSAYEGQYDGQLVSKIVKEILNG